MDAVTLVVAAGAYVAAAIAKKSADALIEAAYKRLEAYVLQKLGRQTGGASVGPDDIGQAGLADDPQVQSFSREVFAHSPALRRAALVASVTKGARVLWVDDEPANNRNECQLLAAFGVRIDQVRSTPEALDALSRATYDLVLSDVARGGVSQAGLQMLQRLGPGSPPVVFYVGHADECRGVPWGAFGITDRPEPLLHLVLDVLERRRI